MLGKKALVWLTIVLLVCGLFAGCGNNNEEVGTDDVKPTVVRLATVIASVHPTTDALKTFKANVEKRTEGRIEIQIFPDSQLGTWNEAFDATRRGEIQMATLNPMSATSSVPTFGALEGYFLFDDTQHAYRVLDGDGGQLLNESLDEFNLEGLGYFTTGFRQFSNNKRPINSLEDLKGLKIRGYSPIQIAAWESVGCNLTNVAWGELFTALQQKLIDGQETANVSFYTNKFYETQDYLSLTNHLYSCDMIYANKDFMASLDAADAEIIREEMKNAIDAQRKAVDDNEEAILNEMANDHGLTINEVPAETRAEMREIINAVVSKEIISKAGQDAYDRMLKSIEDER